MNKQEVKTRLLEAIRNSNHLVDIQSVALFGSFSTGTQNIDSDVDVLVDFVPGATVGFFKLAKIQAEMEGCLGRNVDLLTPRAVSELFRAEVLGKAEDIYRKEQP